MNAPTQFTPPPSSVMLSNQDTRDALRLLIAQRKLYRKAKRWLGLRLFGMAVIGTLAPVISVLRPELAVWAGAVAGLWIFLGRSALVFVQSATTAKAAAIQEQFDFYVFGMPTSIDRSALPSLEDIAKIAGPDSQINQIASKEKLRVWYPIQGGDAPPISIAISQRANASYADSLLRTTAIVWASVTTVWLIVFVLVGFFANLNPITFVAGVLLPLLPAFLDIVQYITGLWRAARDRGDLARAIELRLNEAGESIDPGELLVWQEQLHGLRISTPDVPDFVYKLKWRSNERAMNSAARQLADRARDPN